MQIEMQIKFYDSEINRGAGGSLTILRTGDGVHHGERLLSPMMLGTWEVRE
jgi:hypothetical protein